MPANLSMSLRMEVPSSGARPILGGSGIVVVAVPPWSDMPGLVAVFDEGAGNKGASATNALPTVLTFCADWIDKSAGLAGVSWVQMDSDGLFDLVFPVWSGMRCDAVSWGPVKWPGCAPRSRAAMLRLFGRQGEQAVEGFDRARS